MQYSSDHSVAINEYGSNMFKSKFDPLKTIEAKTAIHGSSREEFNMEKVDPDKDYTNVISMEKQMQQVDEILSSPIDCT